MRLTLLKAKEATSRLAPADQHEHRLNRCVERYLLNGKYIGSMARLAIRALYGQIALPRQFRTIEGVKVDGVVYDITNHWFEFLSGHNDFSGFSMRGVRDLDDGWAVMYTHTPPLSAPSPDPDVPKQDFPDGGTLTVTYTGTDSIVVTISGRDADGMVLPDVAISQAAAGSTTVSSSFARISRIHKERTQAGVRVVFTSADSVQTLVAAMEPDEEETYYRRYIIDAMVGEDISTVIALAKRRHIEFTRDSDLLPIANIGALELGLKALQYEDQNDPSLAKSYWEQGIDVLNKELGDTNAEITYPTIRTIYVGGAPKLTSHR